MEQVLIIILIISIINLLINLETRINLVNKRKKSNLRRVLLDTSVLIDGRILDFAKTGFLNDELVISRSVMGELQLLADGDDADKRARARFGLDIINKLQKLENVTVTIWPDDRKTPEGVDDRLLRLAKTNDFVLATIDYNLNKVAKVEDIMVLNINELAKAIKTNILPGEIIDLKLIQTGQAPDQAVGYLDDGSMIVVANAKKYIGQTKKIEIKRYLQTDAGKMIFAELVKEKKKQTKKVNKKKFVIKKKTIAHKNQKPKKTLRPKKLTYKQKQDKKIDYIINNSN